VAAICGLASVAQAQPVRLASCGSGKAGHLALFVTAAPHGGYTLSSRDDVPGASARVLSGTVTAASHHRLDARHHVYRFELQGGALAQAAGLDAAHCKPAGEGRATCAVTAIEVKLAYHGPKGPGDDGLSADQSGAAIALDNGGPQGCVVYASKALTALLAASK